MQKKSELWRKLKVGDLVRVIEFPPEYLVPGKGLHPETRRAYRYLLKRRRPLKVYRVDEDGLPWVKFQVRHKTRRTEHHWMALNHGGLRIVSRRAN